MKYFLLSKALRFERFFDSAEEVCEYIKAKTGAEYFNYDFIIEYLKEHISYTYSARGIDISIYKRPEQGNAIQSDTRIQSRLQP